MSNKSFFGSFETHTKVKLTIYHEYLKRYLRILQHAGPVESIHIYDMFCGKGYTADNQKGSAILGIEEAITSVSETRTNKQVYIYLNDYDENNCEALRQHVESLEYIPSNVTVEISCKDFHGSLDDIYQSCRSGQFSANDRLLFFIDPYGYKYTDPETMVSIMESFNAEVMLFIPITNIHRFWGADTPNEAIDKWKHFMELEDNNEAPNISDLTELIINKFFSKCIYAGCFTLANQKNNNKYLLLFLTSNLLGLEKFNEVKWKIDPYEGSSMKLNHDNIIVDAIGEAWKKETLDSLVALVKNHIHVLPGEKINNIDLYVILIIHGFLPKHFNEIWKSNQFLVREFLTDRTRSNYVGYKYINEVPLVIFGLKDETEE